MIVMKYRSKCGWWSRVKKMLWRRVGKLPKGCTFDGVAGVGFWMTGSNKREMRKWLLKYYPDRSWNMFKCGTGTYIVFEEGIYNEESGAN